MREAEGGGGGGEGGGGYLCCLVFRCRLIEALLGRSTWGGGSKGSPNTTHGCVGEGRRRAPLMCATPSNGFDTRGQRGWLRGLAGPHGKKEATGSASQPTRGARTGRESAEVADIHIHAGDHTHHTCAVETLKKSFQLV